MTQDRILGEQLEIADVAADIAADPTAIDSIAVGVVNDPAAIASLEAGTDHNNLINGGSPLHFTEASIVHQNIIGAGTNTHALIDAHLAVGSPPIHFTEASIDHDNILNGTGLYSHGAIDTHVGNNTIHFTTLTGLSDVDTAGATTGQVLTYSDSPAGWSPQDASGGGGGGVTNPMTTDLDVGGFAVTAADTVGVGSPVDSAGAVVIESGSSTYAGDGSYAGKLTIKGGDRSWGGYWDTGVIATGSPIDRNSISILGGSGSGYGGGIEIVAGDDGGAQWGEGGNITIVSGAPTHAVNGYGGDVFIQTKDSNISTYAFSTAGDISLIPGNSKWGYAGNVDIKGGDSTNNAYADSTGAAGFVTITGGSIQLPTEGSPILIPGSGSYAVEAGRVVLKGGSGTVGTAVDGGLVTITGGSGGSLSGNGGTVTISGGSAGTGGTGGNIELKPGSGSGGAGEVLLFRDLGLQNWSLRDVGTITYKDENVLTAVGSPPGSSNQVSFLSNTFQTLTLTNVNSIAFSTFGALKTGIYQLRLVDGGTYPPSSWQGIKWQNNTEPTWTASASGDIITFFYDGTPIGSPSSPRNIYYAINVALGFV